MSLTPDSPFDDLRQVIADLQHQLASRTAERDQGLAREAAAAEVLQVINASPGDLVPVFAAILEKAHSLCGAVQGSLFLFDGEYFRAVATRSMPEAFNARMKAGYRGADFSLTRPLLAGEPFNHVVDVALLDHPVARAAVELAGAHTVLAVALRKDNVLLGQIVSARREVHPFTNEQIALLQHFAAQAVIAMENARLITQTREALEQQTATAEVLQVINEASGDLQPVFEAILEKAHRLCGAAKGAFVTFDGTQLRGVATRGLSEPYAAMVRAQRDNPPGSPPDRLLRGERFVHITDFADLDLPIPRAAVELEGIRTVLFVPLRKQGGLLGYITAYRQEVKPFADDEIALLERFAAQAVIAMENARLVAETREALEQQTAAAEVLGVINASPGDLAPIFGAILEKAHSLCGVDHGSLQLYEDGRFHAVAVHGLPAALAERLQQGYNPAPDLPPYELLMGAPYVHVADLAESDAPMARAVVELGGTRTHLLVALRKDGVLLGQIVAARTEVRPFTDKEIALLQSFAAQAVIAMENARLLTETGEALEQQTATAEVLQVINSSPGNLSAVFDAMVEKAIRLCGAAYGTLRTFDGEALHLAAMAGEPEVIARVSQTGPIRLQAGNPFEPLARGERIIHVIDARELPAYREFAATRERIDAAGVRSWLAVALRKGDTLVGAFSVFRRDVRPFSERQVALLENFADQAVIAMKNARLLGELRQRTDEVAELNRGLEARVAEQVDELGRVGRLKRFLAPQLAELIVSQGDEKILESHRREIVVVFCDLRGYTAFTETAEPEEVLDFLREYHGALGPLVSQFEGTLDQFSGDGIMVFFNDPVPIPDAAERAVRMTMAMREAASILISGWRRLGRDLGFGAGIAQGYATLGQIGFSERAGYTAIGTVCNVAARLCAEAKDGQILMSQRVAARLDDCVAVEDIGSLTLKGLMQPVATFNVPLMAGQPAFRVIEGGPQSG